MLEHFFGQSLATRRSPPHNPALTGVRAVAALLVIGTHAAFATGELTHGYIGAIYARLAGMWLPAHLASFAGGMALAVLHVSGTRWRAHVTLPWASALFLVVATPLGGAIGGPDPFWAAATKAMLYAAIATLTVGAVALGSSHRYARMLSSRPMVRLGEISYEIFLLYVTTLAVTIPLAWALHRVTRPSPARALNQLA